MNAERLHGELEKPAPTVLTWRWTCAIFFTALLLRAGHLFSIVDEPFFWELQTEPLRYLNWATAISHGHWSQPLPLDTAPGYPLFLTVVVAAAGASPLAVAVVQIAMDSSSALLAARAAGTAISRPCGITAAFVWALFGPAIYYSAELLPVTLLSFATWTAIVITRTAARRSPEQAVRVGLAGCAWAAAVCIRSEILPVLVIEAILVGRRVGRRHALILAAPCLTYFLILGSVNWQANGKPLPLLVGAGANWWIANATEGDGTNPFLSPTRAARIRALRPADHERVQTDAAMAEDAWRSIAAHPVPAAEHFGRKFLRFWTSRELPNTSDIEWQMSKSSVLRWPLFPIGFGALVAASLAGLLLLVLEVPLHRWSWAASSWATGLAVCLIFLCASRFRALAYPGMVLAGAVGLTALSRWRRWLTQPWHGHRVAAASLAAAFGAFLALSDVARVRDYSIYEIDLNTSLVQLRSGELARAIPRLERAVTAHGARPEAWLLLQRIYSDIHCPEQLDQVSECAARNQVSLPEPRPAEASSPPLNPQCPSFVCPDAH